jgi:O-antigen/teichoic acid export membrane protein
MTVRKTMRSFTSFFQGRPLRVASAFAAQIAGAGLAFLFSVMLARLVGVAGVGLYFLAITIVDIGATISRLGLESASLRFASIAYSQGDRGGLAALYRKSTSLAFGAGIAIALPVWLIASNLSLGGEKAPEFRAELPLLVFAVAPVALLVVQAEFLKAVGATATGTFSQAVVPPLLLLAGSIVLWFLGAGTVHAVFLTYVVVAVASMILAIAMWHWRLPGIWRERGLFDMSLLLRTSMPLLLVNSMNLVLGWTDVLVLGMWRDAAEVGVYGIALRIALLTAFVLSAINVVVAPQFAALHAEGNAAALKRLAQQSAFWTLVAAAPAILVLLLVPDLILQIFGPQFKEGAGPLRILALGQFVNVATGSVGVLLVMTGHEKLMRNIVAASAALNLLGNLALVPRYGAMGAAVSTGLSLAFMNIISWLMVRKKLHINVLDYAALRKPPCASR